MTQISIFLDTTFEDPDTQAEIYSVTRCGNLSPLLLTDSPSLDAFTATKAVAWSDSETINEEWLPDETQAEYDLRMEDAVNSSLGKLQGRQFQATIMSIPLFKASRGNED